MSLPVRQFRLHSVDGGHASSRRCPCRSYRTAALSASLESFDFLDPQIAKLHALTVALQANAAGVARKSGVLVRIGGILQAAVEIGVHDLLAVKDDHHLAA